jgi:tRNA-(MS[2]IO[6]A)-hydroxylase (MiaE)
VTQIYEPSNTTQNETTTLTTDTLYNARFGEGAEQDPSIADQTAEGMRKFYGLAKHQAWDVVKDLSWGQITPVPEGNGSAIKRGRRHAMWRSVVTQQLQADLLASQLSIQLMSGASDHEARLFYSSMMQDEARHYEAWLRLAESIGGTCEPDPYLERLGELAMKADTLEEKIWLLQVAYEGMVIPRFHQIANAAPGTILAEICTKLAIDDGVHHGAGMCYERLLLSRATPKAKRDIERLADEMWPLFVNHLLWRPREREWASAAMRDRDAALVREHAGKAIVLAHEFGLDISFPY